VIEPLLAMLDAKTDARERQMAIQALGAHGSGQATARLLAWLEEGEADDVASVLAALGEIGDLRALPALTAHLKHDSPRVRSRAAHALAKMNSRAAVEPLLACLDDGHEDVVTAVMRTFGQLGDPRAFEPLRKRLNDKSIAVTYAAVDALGRLNDPRAAKPLVDLLFERQGNHGGITKTITTALCRTRDGLPPFYVPVAMRVSGCIGPLPILGPFGVRVFRCYGAWAAIRRSWT
jgi:HEAT repeat protein